jgi:hypothetical protein
MDDWRPVVDRLQQALFRRRWSEVAAVAEQLRRAKTGGASFPASRPMDLRNQLLRWVGRKGRNMNPQPTVPATMPTADRFLLWIDALGGFLVCLSDEVVLGRAGVSTAAHVPILADVSARHAVIRRDAEGYWLEPVRSVRVDGRPIERPTTLADGQMIELGDSVRLRFRRPHPLSATARLESVSFHRTQPAADGILLMADSCILGSHAQSHVVLPELDADVVLFRQGPGLACRTAGSLRIDDAVCQQRGRLTLQSRVVGDNFSFTLEGL